MMLTEAVHRTLVEFLPADGDRTICIHCLRSAPPDQSLAHAEGCVIGSLSAAFGEAIRRSDQAVFPDHATTIRTEARIHDRESRN